MVNIHKKITRSKYERNVPSFSTQLWDYTDLCYQLAVGNSGKIMTNTD